MRNKSLKYLLIIILIIFSSVQTVNSEDDLLWWNDNWLYRQEIIMPIDTSGELSKNQPFDMRINFNSPCWGENETEHSIRVIFQENDDFQELEFQIYDLNFSDGKTIKSCSLIFLIPDYANGNEKYYIYYDSNEKEPINNPKRVHIEDSYYSYEPIPGYPFESQYYKISQNNEIIYAIAQSGKFMGAGIAQQVTKLKPKAADVMPKNGELFASFDFLYYYGTGLDDHSGSIDNLISKEILIDGNLMVKCRIVSESSKEDIRTSVTYTYYYCPTDIKRIYSKVKHETLKEFTVATEPEVEGSYASLQCGGLESNSIKDLNFGEIYPFLHIYGEQEEIKEYKLNPDPNEQAGPGKWSNTMIISGEDDIDLGKKAWVSYDEGETGVAHSLILGSNSVLTQGSGEKDGVQLKLREQDSTDLPGLESNMAFVQFSRNIFEPGQTRDVNVPDDLVVEYDAEFFSTTNGGYKAVDEEAEIFQTLVKYRPSEIIKDIEDSEEKKGYSLTTYLHMAPSIPFGSALSVITGRDLSFINVELYVDNNLQSTEVASRLSTKPIPSFENTRLIKKIKLAIGIFDWKNISLFKKVRFQNLESGDYLVKVFKENPKFRKEREYIGFKTIEIKNDISTHILCRPERQLHVNVNDQNGDGVENVKVYLLKNENTIDLNTTDEDGFAKLKAPCGLIGNYNLKVQYNGFTIYNDSIKLRFIKKIIPVKKNVDIEIFNFQIEIFDTWNLQPEYEIQSVLTSKDMQEPIEISSEKKTKSNYQFYNLLPAKYQLSLRYKSVIEEIEIDIPKENKISLIFPAEFEINTKTFNSRGIQLESQEIIFKRQGKSDKKISDDKGSSIVILPPGTYNVEIYNEEELVGKRKINVMGDRNFELITNVEPIYPTIVTIFAIIFIISAVFISVRKREIWTLLKLLAIGIAIISVISPWWTIQSDSINSEIETNTNLYLIPPEMISLTSTSDSLAGERSALPEIFIIVLTLILIVITIGCFIVLLYFLLKRYKKNKLSILSLFLGSASFIGGSLIFYYAMSEIARIGIGSVFGSGQLSISIVGEETRASIQAHWGPSIGFYLCLISGIILLICTFYNLKKNSSEKNLKSFLQKENFIKNLKKLLPLVGIVILIYLIINIGASEIVSTFLKISPLYVILAATLTLPRILIRNIAWQRILKIQKINLKFLQSLKIFLIGYFYGSVTPAYMGQLMRIPYMKEKTNQPVGKLFVNCFVETAVHTLSLYGMIVVGAFLVIDYIPEALPIALTLLIATLLIYGLFIKEERGARIFHFLINLLIPKKFKPIFRKFVNTFYLDFPSVKKLIIPFLLGIPTWIIIYTQIYILGLSLDIEVPYFVFLMIYPIANIVAFIPVTAAGLGTREATLVFLFSFFGMSPEKAVVISLAGHILTDVLTGFYGFIISIFEAKDKKKDLSEINYIIKESSSK